MNHLAGITGFWLRRSAARLCVLALVGCAQPTAAPPKQEPRIAEKPAPTQEPKTKKKDEHSKKPALPRQKDKDKNKPTILGWVEKVTLLASDHTVKAKLDSGAKTSSVDAEIIKVFKRDGARYVLYRVMLDDDISETYESRLVRWVRIKKKEGGYQRRPVVKMQFCLGKKTMRGEVSLAERGHFIYPVLIGRNMLEKGNILVDTSKTFLSKPKCSS